MAKLLQNTYCPLSREECREDCRFLSFIGADDDENQRPGECSIFNIMVNLNKIENLLELIRVERG